MTRDWTIKLNALEQPRRRHVRRPVLVIILLVAGCSLLYRYDAPRRSVSTPLLTPSALPKPQPPVLSVQLAGVHGSRSGLAPLAMDVSLSSRSALPGSATGVAAAQLSAHRTHTIAPGEVSALAVQLPVGRSSAVGNQPAVSPDIFSQQQ
ncbi:MAG: hypothetical protein HKL96_08290 [Phycisphaerales bacterium]|nr:hypothetical protein [Phycisphaerales bacterium]